MQNVITLETKKYSIKLENFEGPLDVLCHLIDKNKMDIYDINVSEITDQYIEFIKQMKGFSNGNSNNCIYSNNEFSLNTGNI